MAVTRVRIVYYSHSCECRGVPFHSPLQLRALVVYTLLVVLSPQGVSQGLLYPPRGLIHTLFASPLDGTVSSSFPHPPPLQRRWQTHFPQLTLRLAQNFSPITYLRQGIEWLSHECELFTIFTPPYLNQSSSSFICLILKSIFLQYSMLLGEETSRNHQAYRRGHLDVTI